MWNSSMLTKLMPDSGQMTRLRESVFRQGSNGAVADSSAPRGLDPEDAMGLAETTVGVQQQLASLILDVAQRLVECLECIQGLQRQLMGGVQDYVAFDPTGLDASTMTFVQEVAEAFADVNQILTQQADVLKGTLSNSCKQAQQECEGVTKLIRGQEEADGQVQHYEAKLQQLREDRGQAVFSDKVVRNEDKLQQARQLSEERRQEVASGLEVFQLRRTVQARMTLHAFLRTYAQLMAGLGARSQAIADAFTAELQPGRTAEIVGLAKNRELNGKIVTIEKVDSDTGRCVVRTKGGEQKAIKCESLRPAEDGDVIPGCGPDFPADDTPCDADAGTDSPKAAAEPFGEPEGAGAAAAAAAADGAREQQPAPDKEPNLSPTEGPGDTEQEVELRLESPLDGPISEVVVGGELAQVLESSRSSARVLLPLWANRGGNYDEHCALEVRTDAWKRHVAHLDTRFRYYETIGFGAAGRSIRLVQAPGSPPKRAPQIAERSEGLLHGIAVTEAPLRPAALAAQEAAGEAAGDAALRGQSYYFEVEVLDMLAGGSSGSTTKTLFVGFAWPEHRSDGAPASIQETLQRRPLPETASEMRRAFVAGGELPRFYLDGRSLGKVSGWRPRKDVGAGSVVGVLLEVLVAGDLPRLRLTVFHNGVRCCAAETDTALDAGVGPGGDYRGGLFHGLVDVCGSVRRVALRQDVRPPAPPPAPEAPDDTVSAAS